MDYQEKKWRFIRRKSPAAGVVIISVLVFLFFCILLFLFAVKSSLGLLSSSQLKSSVTAMLDDDAFRTKVADVVVAIAPSDILVTEQVAEVMKDEQVAEAVGQLGSDWFGQVVNDDSQDPVDAVLSALENPEQEEAFSDALSRAMKELDCTDEDLHNAAVTLSDEMGFEPPPKGSSNLEVVSVIMDGSREKITGEASQVIKAVEETKNALGGISSLLNLVDILFGNVVFLLINLCLLLILYGLAFLALRNPWKPCYFLSVPYLLVGGLLMCLKILDAPSLAKTFEAPELVGSILNVVLDSAFSNGLIGFVIGLVLLVVGITVTIIMNCTYNEKEET